MINSLVRGALIYVAVIGAVRLMGKRQIGQLQPSELVITIILSEVAAMPLQNSSVPLFTCLGLVFLLASFEVISSVLSVKFPSFRKLIQGNSVLVIKNGEIVQKELGLIRYSVDDLTEALRLKDVFDIQNVDFAYVETNGAVSVKLKKDCRPPTNNDDKTEDGLLPCLIISNGKIVKHEFDLCNMTEAKLQKILKQKKLNEKDILLMTADCKDHYYIVKKQVNTK
ncbi:MAG: DUF421 domain-containing protein [Clostridia bacterium]|nr:DUF421 domain-containing protein [Clostridia bacterium]